MMVCFSKKLFFMLCCIGLAGCGDSVLSTIDLSDFEEFNMDIVGGLRPDCPCAACPLSARIIRQADGGFYLSFEEGSRTLTTDEADRSNEMFQTVETRSHPSFLFQCVAGTAPKCRIYFSWSLLNANSLFASNTPCVLGATAVLTPLQTREIMAFIEDIAAE